MENYPIFRWVMLHFRGGSLRVTNPFAEGLNPLDLHALSTLPAFILSQDQTLNKNRETLAGSPFVHPALTRDGGHTYYHRGTVISLFATAQNYAVALLTLIDKGLTVAIKKEGSYVPHFAGSVRGAGLSLS